MARYIIVLLVILSITACNTRRHLSSLDEQEKERINDLRSQQKLCEVKEIEDLDDGTTAPEYLSELVMWKCGKYLELVKDVLYEEYDVDLGEAWSYANELRQVAPKEISEAIIQRRKTMDAKTDKNSLLKKDSEPVEEQPYQGLGH